MRAPTFAAAEEILGEGIHIPGKLLGVVAAPFHDTIYRDVRRSLGMLDEPEPPESNPDRAYLPPNGVARRAHADLPSMVIGGLAALLLQSLHPLAMAGVAEHSNYATDPLGRLRRTATFVGRTTFGSVEQAEAAIAQVRRIHRHVHGVAPDGRTYSANDPALVTWIHVAETSCFLAAAERYGPDRFSRAERDDYFDEVAPLAKALGATWVPRSTDEIAAYLHRIQPELYAGPQARAARDFLLRGVARRPEDRAVHLIVASAAVGILPKWARDMLGIPNVPLLNDLVVSPITRTFCAGLRWAIRPPS